MQGTAFTHQTPTIEFQRPPSGRSRNPWVSDHVLLGLSFWWVQSTRSQLGDIRGEVSTVFRSLQLQLQ